MTVRLRYRAPYDWPAMLSFLSARAIPGMELVEDDAYSRVIDLGGAIGSVQVTQARDEDALIAHIRFPVLLRLPAIIARLWRVFDLTADPEAINEHLVRDARLAPMVAARPGLRAPGGWDGFELAVRAILGQQITVKAAIGLAGKLVERYGEPALPSATGDARLTHAFPRPERMASDDLQLGMPPSRVRSLRSLASAVADDPNLLGMGRSLEEAIERLKALPGVGEWTAHYIALRGMREPDAFPAGDVGLMRAFADETGLRPTAAQLLERAEAWRPWRAYAAQHLWAASSTVAGKAA
nr:AlkA N-terminal domain-containing protein [Rhizobium multihospitium]